MPVENGFAPIFHEMRTLKLDTFSVSIDPWDIHATDKWLSCFAHNFYISSENCFDKNVHEEAAAATALLLCSGKKAHGCRL